MAGRVFPHDPSSSARLRAVRAWIISSVLACLALAYASNVGLFALLALVAPVCVSFYLSCPVVEGAKYTRARWYEFRADMIAFGGRRRHTELLLQPGTEVKVLAVGETHLLISHAGTYLFPRYYRDDAGATFELVSAEGRVRLAPRDRVPEVHALVPRIEI